ncbi:MAG: SpoIID/LytB domain-containing protein [Nitrospirota bacterium]
MKRLIIAIMALMLVAPPAALAQKVRVLVMDEGFKRLPDKEEKPELLDSLSGELIVGMSDYRGEIEVWRGKNGLYLINELSLEDYVEGVVKAETADDWEEEALKAQAVIVRTYVLKQMMRQREEMYHVTSSVLHQVYKGLNTDPKVTEAVRETRGQVLTYAGEPIMAFYHSTGGGKTELPEEVFGQGYPYLKSVEAEGRLSPLNVWARRIPLEDIEEAVGVEHLRDITVSSRTATGRAEDVAFVANPEVVTMKAQEFRKRLGWRRLPSTNFTLSVRDGYANFEGSGYGHGVGLCQWTALEMAREGMAYEEILSYFYPEAELVHDTFGF